MRLTKFFLILLTGLFLLSVAPPTFAQDDIIKQRKKLMRANDNTYKTSLKKAVKARDYAAIQSGTKKILARWEKLPNLFPKGSTAKNSRALKIIWKDQDGFKQNQGWVKASVNALAAAAVAKDNDLVDLEYKAVNAACNQCHRSFRKSSRRGKKKRR